MARSLFDVIQCFCDSCDSVRFNDKIDVHLLSFNNKSPMDLALTLGSGPEFFVEKYANIATFV